MIKCEDCTAKCCRYVSVGLDTPKTLKAFDEIRWMVAHKNVIVYKDTERDWVVSFLTDCENLDDKNQCKIYETRMKLCKDHDSKTCEVNGKGPNELILFRTMKDVEDYVKKKLGKDLVKYASK
ncbi:hypothetical protein COV11_00075 [Candidatus Woesearchaeota archaeon CG10_big_fil_rev_8_21_14_0_10_30_7]|nr:MAG: hypothetical protein COV11_00075 [Candidatus Woesearchaeota archaeon CG10_big_fil_rev_8_21_14_0_10_30_7]